MEAKYKAGDTAFIVESNCHVREVEIRSCSGGMYLVKFKDNGGGIRVKEHRIFTTQEETEASLPKKEIKAARKTPYDYM